MSSESSERDRNIKATFALVIEKAGVYVWRVIILFIKYNPGEACGVYYGVA